MLVLMFVRLPAFVRRLARPPAADPVLHARRRLRPLAARRLLLRRKGSDPDRLTDHRALARRRLGASFRTALGLFRAALLLARAAAAQAARRIEVSGSSGGGTHGFAFSPCILQSCFGIHAERFSSSFQ